MNIETRYQIILHAVRWCNNILIELLNNHGRILPAKAHSAMHDMLHNTAKISSSITKAQNESKMKEGD